jgi:hypothetical protein
MKRRSSPEVGDREIEEMMALLLQRPYGRGLTPEARAAHAYEFVLNYTMATGASNAYAKALADRVRKRLVWTKVPD